MKNSKSLVNYAKTKNGKLEKKRSLFFQIGMILSLAFVLAAFEWTTVRTYTLSDWNLGENIPIEQMIDVTVQEQPKPKPKPVIQTSIIEIIDNNTPVEVEEIIWEEPDEGLNDLDYFVDEESGEEEEEPVIFISSEQKPLFPGGDKAMYDFLYDRIKYPEIARELGIQGTVYVKFVVWNDGSIRNIQLLRGIGGGCDEEALRIVKLMPKWKPGLQRTLPVNVQMVLPVKFVLK
ncbi:MAG: energy transducer TonB [Bacteroidales bacterium]|nr:energy transducer TonB [Bacteroidales bacterium]